MPRIEICILAGGLSQRMGCDKSQAKVGRQTLLQRARKIARQTKWPVRVIRRDLVERCGPLGGIHAALKTTKAGAVLFMACDMPFVTPQLLEMLIDRWTGKSGALFTRSGKEGKAGFPFILRRDLLPVVEQQLEEGLYSLQALATRGRAKFLVAKSSESLLFNVNTPDDLLAARKWAAKVGPVHA